jgi:hypothetical protein
MKTRKEIRNLIIFTIIVILSGWLGLLVNKVIPEHPEGDSLGMGIWLVMPLLAVIALRTFAGDGWKDAALNPRLKSNAVWYVVALLIFPFVTSIVLLIGSVFGWIDLSGFSLSYFIPIFFSLLIFEFIKNILEESVWRGYLTTKLIKLNLSDISLYLIVGLIWSVWHLPYYMEFLPEEVITSVLPVSRFAFFLVGVFTMTVWTVMFVEIFRLTNSIWPAVLLHAVEDAVINPLVIDGHITISSGMEIFISPICGIIPTALYLMIGLWLRGRRMSISSDKRF